ncbi:MAG: hypothetical protein WEB79_00205, partial [Thermoleophilaceae bacterium]
TPGYEFVRMGQAGSWAPGEEPDIAAGPSGQLVLAVVKKDGRLFTRTGAIGSGWSDFHQQGSGGWATASITVGSDGRYRLLATKKSGDLYYRIGTPGYEFVRMGQAGSWAPGEEPDIAAGPSGQLVLAVVKKDGRLFTRTGAIGSGWNDFHQQGQTGGWSTTSASSRH